METKDTTFAGLLQRRPVWLLLTAGLIVGPLFNTGLNYLTGPLRLPFFFDSIATAIIAAVYGPLAGVLTGLSTNWYIEIFSGFPMTHYPFGICGAATGLIIGILAKKDKFSTIHMLFISILVVTIANSVLGALIAAFVFGGITDTNLAYLVTGIVAAGRSLFSAAFLARLPVNLVDKSIAVAAAFIVYNRFYLQRPVFSAQYPNEEK